METRNTPLGLENDHTRLSWDFTLRKFVPTQKKRFTEHLKRAKDLPDSWKNHGTDIPLGDREKERQLGNLGIQLFESFQSQWLGTLLVQQWIRYLQRTNGTPGITACCREDNARSAAMLAKLGVRAPRYDHMDEITNEYRLAFYLDGKRRD